MHHVRQPGGRFTRSLAAANVSRSFALHVHHSALLRSEAIAIHGAQTRPRVLIDLGGHISELAAHRVATVADTVQIGDRVRVSVVGIDSERRRLFRSIRQADAPKIAPRERTIDTRCRPSTDTWQRPADGTVRPL